MTRAITIIALTCFLIVGAAATSILFNNQSSRYVLMRSFNCTEFSIVGLQAGVSRYTMPFNPAGKACDYFAYDYPKKIFVGRVYVQ